MTDSTPAKLRELLLNEFSEEELNALCASLGIDYGRLAGTGAFGKTRALIDTAKSQDKIRALQAKVRELRPDAYESAGLAAIPDPVVMGTPAATPALTEQQTTSSSRAPLWPWLALALIVLLCTIAGMVLLLPRLQAASQPAPAAVAPISTAIIQSVDATPTETPPAIVEVTDSLDKGAGVLTGTEQVPEASATTVDATDMPIEGTPTNAAIIITVTATPKPVSVSSAITPTTTVTNTHSSISVIRVLNDQLPRFYTGEVDAQALQQYWTGEALRSVMAFGTVRLPRAMRIQPSQRNTIQATYEYRREPALVRAAGDTAVVNSREFWRYATSANATVICEVRDYVYNLVRVDGQFKVGTFNSRLVESGCDQ